MVRQGLTLERNGGRRGERERKMHAEEGREGEREEEEERVCERERGKRKRERDTFMNSHIVLNEMARLEESD
jgi:hypothetical protein